MDRMMMNKTFADFLAWLFVLIRGVAGRGERAVCVNGCRHAVGSRYETGFRNGAEAHCDAGFRHEALPHASRYEALPHASRDEALTHGARYEALTDGARYEALTDGARYEALPYGFRYEALPHGARYEVLTDGARYEALPRNAVLGRLCLRLEAEPPMQCVPGRNPGTSWRGAAFAAAFWLLVYVASAGSAAAASFSSALSIPGEATDLFDGGSGLHLNRLGGFGSDLYYHRASDTYYGLSDRGPGEGFFSHVPRVQQYHVNVDPETGALSAFELQKTILFKSSDGSRAYDVLNPPLLQGDASTLGFSFDPEGFVVAPGGNFYVADEYGPSLYEFAPVNVGDTLEAQFVRALDVPENLVPRDSNGAVNYVAERETQPALVSGRQDNRGFEGLAISPSGDTLFAVLQDPLAEEGDRGEGRRSRNVRIVAFNTASGESTGQFIYQLEDVATINERIAYDFEDRRQGRQIGVSSVRALNDHELLVMERDNRGIGAENPINADPEAADVSTKRLYQIDISGATDVSAIRLAGESNLPANVTPVSKSLMLDVHGALQAAGLATPEKIEGFAIGPRLNDGQYALLFASDNDFSALRMEDNGQLVDVYTDGSTGPVDGDPQGRTLLPSFLYSFRAELPSYVEPDVIVPPLLAGDADQDYDFDQIDLVQVQQAAKYLTGQAATWGEGDWNGAPGGKPGNPPAGDGVFNQLDVVAALTSGVYLTGSYASTRPKEDGSLVDYQLNYDAKTGEVSVQASAGVPVDGVYLTLAADVLADGVAATPDGRLGLDVAAVEVHGCDPICLVSRSFGTILQPGLPEDVVQNALHIASSRIDGGMVDHTLIYVPIPEPGALTLLLCGVAAILFFHCHRTTTSWSVIFLRKL